MKKSLKIKNFRLLAISLIAFITSGCSINDSDTSSAEDLTDEELEMAGQIIAESLSDQKDGIFASLNDAFTLPSSSNLVGNSSEKGKYTPAVFNTAMAKNENTENNYNYTYDPETGVHLVNFSRIINRKDFSKESTAELTYIYYDIDGSYIYSPRLDNDRIETIDYNGSRTGSIITPTQNSSYDRSDQFMIDGLTSESDILKIDGLHEGSGQFKVTRENGDTVERYYTLTVEFLDVQINNKILSAKGSLQYGVEGALAYEIMINKNINGDESMKTVNGTIEFNGDGTAFLRFQNAFENFKIKLEDGNLFKSDEFKGFVKTVDTENESFTLSDNKTYLFGTGTEIDPEGDLISLEEIEAVFASDIRVKSEGIFINNTDGANIVQTVKFTYASEDLEFEADVESAEANTFTLVDGTVLVVNDDSAFDNKGDLTNLAAVVWAIDNEFKVKAEGKFSLEENGSLTVTEVKFEYDEDDFEFEDDVDSVNLEESSFTLSNSRIYIINEFTKIDDKGDLHSLEEVAAALSDGREVEAEGEYAPQSDGSLLVKEVEFKTDDEGNEHKFEGIVESADAAAKTFTLTNGLVLTVDENTEFDDDIQSLGNLVGALQRGDKVYAKGTFYIHPEGSSIAIEAEFDVDRNNSNDNDEEREDFDFEGTVQSADAAAKTFALTSGLVLHVNNNTEFGGDINSLGNLVAALQRRDRVAAEGIYYIDEDGKNIAIEVEFEAEENTDDADDD